LTPWWLREDGTSSGRGCGVPLSEDEQRILHEIEQQFYEQDPAFARQVGSTTVYRHAGRNLKWATLGFVGGLVLMLATFTSSLFLGSVGVAVMFVCAVIFERNLRRMGRAGWQSVTRNMRTSNLRTSIVDARKRMRDRFRRDD
jgi:hypothetical protein